MTDCRTCLTVPAASARDAARLWTGLVPGSSIDREVQLDGPGNPMLLDLTIGGGRFQVLGADGLDAPSTASSFTLVVADQAALDRVWDGFLAAGGHEIQCGWICDPYGFSWQVLPQVFADAMSDDDPAVRQAAAEVSWSSVRIDAAVVAAAVDAARG